MSTLQRFWCSEVWRYHIMVMYRPRTKVVCVWNHSYSVWLIHVPLYVVKVMATHLRDCVRAHTYLTCMCRNILQLPWLQPPSIIYETRRLRLVMLGDWHLAVLASVSRPLPRLSLSMCNQYWYSFEGLMISLPSILKRRDTRSRSCCFDSFVAFWT